MNGMSYFDDRASPSRLSPGVTAEELTSRFVEQLQQSWSSDREQLMKVSELSKSQNIEIQGLQRDVSEYKESFSLNRDLNDSLEKIISVDNSKFPHYKLLTAVRNIHSRFSPPVSDGLAILVMIRSGLRWTLVSSLDNRMHSFIDSVLDKACTRPASTHDSQNMDWKNTEDIMTKECFDNIANFIKLGHDSYKIENSISNVVNSHFAITLLVKQENAKQFTNDGSLISVLDSAINEYEYLKDVFHSMIRSTMVCFMNYLETSKTIVEHKSQLLQKSIAQEMALMGDNTDLFLQNIYKILFQEELSSKDVISSNICLSNVQNYANVPEVFFLSTRTEETHILKSKVSPSNQSRSIDKSKLEIENDTAFLFNQMPQSECNLTVLSSLIHQTPRSSIVSRSSRGPRGASLDESILSIPILCCNCKNALKDATKCNCSCSIALVFTREIRQDDGFFISEEALLNVQCIIRNCLEPLQDYFSKVLLFQKSLASLKYHQNEGKYVPRIVPDTAWFDDFLENIDSYSWSPSKLIGKPSIINRPYNSLDNSNNQDMNTRKIFLSNFRASFGLDYCIGIVHKNDNSLYDSSDLPLDCANSIDNIQFALLDDDNETLVQLDLLEGDVRNVIIRSCGITLKDTTDVSNTQDLQNSNNLPILTSNDEAFSDCVPNTTVLRSTLSSSGFIALARALMSPSTYSRSAAAGNSSYEYLLKIPEIFHDVVITCMSMKSTASEEDDDLIGFKSSVNSNISIIIVGGKIGFSKSSQYLNTRKLDIHSLFVSSTRVILLKRIFHLKSLYKTFAMRKRLEEKSLKSQMDIIAKFERKLSSVLTTCYNNNQSNSYEESRLLVFETLTQILKLLFQEILSVHFQKVNACNGNVTITNEPVLIFNGFSLVYYNQANERNLTSNENNTHIYSLNDLGQWRRLQELVDSNDDIAYESSSNSLKTLKKNTIKSKKDNYVENVDFVLMSQGSEVLSIKFSILIPSSHKLDKKIEVNTEVRNSLIQVFSSQITDNSQVASWFLSASEYTSTGLKSAYGPSNLDNVLFGNEEIVDAALFEAINHSLSPQTISKSYVGSAQESASRNLNRFGSITDFSGDKCYFESKSFKVWKRFIENISKSVSGISDFRLLSLVLIKGENGYIIVPRTSGIRPASTKLDDVLEKPQRGNSNSTTKIKKISSPSIAGKRLQTTLASDQESVSQLLQQEMPDCSEIIPVPATILSLLLGDIDENELTPQVALNFIEFLRSHRNIPEMSIFSRADVGIMLREANGLSHRGSTIRPTGNSSDSGSNVRFFTLMSFSGYLNVMKNRFSTSFNKNIKSSWRYFDLIKSNILNDFEPFLMVFQSFSNVKESESHNKVELETSHSTLDEIGMSIVSNFKRLLESLTSNNMAFLKNKIEDFYCNGFSNSNCAKVDSIDEKFTNGNFSQYNRSPLEAIVTCWNFNDLDTNFSLASETRNSMNQQENTTSGSNRRFRDIQTLHVNQTSFDIYEEDSSLGLEDSIILPMYDAYSGNNITLTDNVSFTYEVLPCSEIIKCFIHGNNMGNNKQFSVNNENFFDNLSENSSVIRLVLDFFGEGFNDGSRSSNRHISPNFSCGMFIFTSSFDWYDAKFKNSLISMMRAVASLSSFYYLRNLSAPLKQFKIYRSVLDKVKLQNKEIISLFSNLSHTMNDLKQKLDIPDESSNIESKIKSYYDEIDYGKSGIFINLSYFQQETSSFISSWSKFESLILSTTASLSNLQEKLISSREINTYLTEFIQNIDSICQHSSLSFTSASSNSSRGVGRNESNLGGAHYIEEREGVGDFFMNEMQLKLLTIKISIMHVVFSNVLNSLASNQKNIRSSLLTTITKSYEQLSGIITEFNEEKTQFSEKDGGDFSIFMHKLMRTSLELSKLTRSGNNSNSISIQKSRDISLYTLNCSKELEAIQKRNLYSVDLFNKCIMLEDIVRIETQGALKADFRQLAGRASSNHKIRASNLGDVVEYHPILAESLSTLSDNFLSDGSSEDAHENFAPSGENRLLGVVELRSPITLASCELHNKLLILTKNILRTLLDNREPDDGYFRSIYKVTKDVLEVLRSNSSNLLTIVESLLPPLQELLARFFRSDCCIFIKDSANNTCRGFPTLFPIAKADSNLKTASGSNINSKTKTKIKSKNQVEILSFSMEEFESKLHFLGGSAGIPTISNKKCDNSILRGNFNLECFGRSSPCLIARREIDLSISDSPFELLFVLEKNSSYDSYMENKHDIFSNEDENHLLSFSDNFFLLVKSVYNEYSVSSLQNENVELKSDAIQLKKNISDLIFQGKVFQSLSYYFSSIDLRAIINNSIMSNTDGSSASKDLKISQTYNSKSSSASDSVDLLSRLTESVFCANDYGCASSTSIFVASSEEVSAIMSAEVIYRFNFIASINCHDSSGASADQKEFRRPLQVVHQQLDSLLLYISVAHYYSRVVTIDPGTNEGGHLMLLKHGGMEKISEKTVGVAIIPLWIASSISHNAPNFFRDQPLTSIILVFDDIVQWNNFQYNLFKSDCGNSQNDNQFSVLINNYINGIEERLSLSTMLTGMSLCMTKSREIIDLFDNICSNVLSWNADIASISVDGSGADTLNFIENKMKDVISRIASAFSNVKFSNSKKDSASRSNEFMTESKFFWTTKASQNFHNCDYDWYSLNPSEFDSNYNTQNNFLNSKVSSSMTKVTLSNVMLDILFDDNNYGYFIDFENSSLWLLVEIQNSNNNVGNNYCFLFQLSISKFSELFSDFRQRSSGSTEIEGQNHSLRTVTLKCINDLKQLISIVLYSNFKTYSALLYTHQLTHVINHSNCKLKILSDIIADLSSEKHMAAILSGVDDNDKTDSIKGASVTGSASKVLPLTKLAKKIIKRLLNFPDVEAVSLSCRFLSDTSSKSGNLADATDTFPKANFESMTDDEILDYNTFNFYEIAFKEDCSVDKSKSNCNFEPERDLSRFIKVEYRMQYNDLGGSLILYYTNKTSLINSTAKISSNFLASNELLHSVKGVMLSEVESRNNKTNSASESPPVTLSVDSSSSLNNSRDRLESIRRNSMLMENIIFEQISKSFLRRALEYKFGSSLKSTLKSQIQYISIQKTKEAELKISNSELEAQLDINIENNNKLLLEIEKLRAKNLSEQSASRETINHYKLLNSQFKQTINENKVERAKLEARLNDIVNENKESNKHLIESNKTEKKENDKLKSEIDRLKIALKKGESQMKLTQDQLENKEAILKSQKINLEAALQKLSSENLKLCNENSRLQSREAKLLETHDHGGSRLKSLLNDVEIQRQSLVALESQIATLRKENVNISTENVKLLEKISSLNEQMNRDRLLASSRLTDAQEISQRLNNEILDLKVRLQTELDISNRMKIRVNSLETEKKSLLDGWTDVFGGNGRGGGLK